MKKQEIFTYVKLDLTKQVSKPRRKNADVQLNRKDLVVSNSGTLMDKDSFAEWASNKSNACYK